MSNYVKAVDYSAKDALASGNPNKIIKGTELNDEFNAIATAVGTKADIASPVFLGNPTATTQSFGNNSTRLATTAFVQTALQALHPIGSIYISVTSTNPNTLFGFGTWIAFATGKTIFGFDSGNTAFDTAEETGGSADAVVVSHTHTLTDPGHVHALSGLRAYNVSLNDIQMTTLSPNNTAQGGPVTSTSLQSATTGISIASSGVSGVNANLPPYVTVYMWKRTA